MASRSRKGHEFLRTTVRDLGYRVGLKCSNPKCRATTHAPGAGDVGVSNLGVGAHIHAAASGGPRYLSTMSPAERRAAANCIYLCVPCSIKIDRDEAEHPATLLESWKLQAERMASEEQCQRLPTPADAKDELVSMLIGSGPRLLPRVIGNAHGATKAALEALDPRFDIETTFDGKNTHVTLNAKEEVAFTIQLDKKVLPEWARQMQLLEDEGRPVDIPAQGIRIKGSKIFEEIVAAREAGGSLTVVPKGIVAVLKLTLSSPDGLTSEQLDDAVGELRGGRKAASFEGGLFDGRLAVSMRTDVVSGGTDSVFHLAADFERWTDVLLSELPYFERLKKTFDRLLDGWSLKGELEVQGLRLFGFEITVPTDASSPVAESVALLRYTEMARKMAAFLKLPLRFHIGEGVGSDDFEALAYAVGTAEGKIRFDRSGLNSNPSCVLIADKGAANIELLRSQTDSAVIKIVGPSKTFAIFDQEVTTPSVELLLNGVTPVLETPAIAFVEGDAVRVEWLPAAHFNASIMYCRD